MAEEEFASGGEHPIPESLVSPPNPPSPASKAGMNRLLLKPECKTALSDFIRIFSFSTWLDRVLVSAAVATSIGAGITMPLMNMIFGRMVGSFTGYYGADASTTYELFKNAISSCAWSLTLVTSSGLVLIIVVYAATTPFLVKHMNGVQYADLQASIVANEVFSSIRMIAACGAQEKMAKRYVKWVDDSRHRGLKMSPTRCSKRQFSIYATFALSIWYSIRMYYELRFNSAETLVVCVTTILPAMFTAKYRTNRLIGLASSVLMSIGCSTIVGDAGIKLSGGQRQRIAIARSMVKRPKILILDEATSSIDVRGEHVVQAALKKVSKDRTTIMIAHRLGTVKKADNIIILQKGQAVQQGTHSDLLAEEGGAYWALATLQKLVVDSTHPKELPSGLGGEVEDTEVNTPTVNSGSPVITTDASVDEELITTSRLRKYTLLICEQKDHWKWYAVLYFDNIISQSIGFFDTDDHSVGTLTARLATDPSQLQEILGINMAFVLISILNVAGCLIISFYYGWKLTIVTLCSSMPLISAKFATESNNALRTVSALTLEDTIIERYETLLREHVQHSFGKSSWFTLVFAVADSIALLCTAFVLWYGGSLMLKGEYWSFQYMIVYIAVLQVCLHCAYPASPMRPFIFGQSSDDDSAGQGGLGAGQWLSFGPNIAKANVAVDRILEMRAKGQENTTRTLLDRGSVGDKDSGVRVEFRDVRFRTGCGKTTVVSLLERFYAVNSGQILYNGTDISTVSLEDYRRDISLVSQEPNLFNGKIRENILLGVNPDSTTEEQIQQACRDAEIHEFILSLPDGYNTEIGSRGVTLTRKNRTMIMVAHRLATIQNADIIFVLGDGRVLEKGNHAALLRMRGIYYQMCQAQALDG
ncbi:P-loop containing nucleoside triphosphate hydrolase protein [Neurospora hispaniola]|uniref:P-loop containing nucleoside triphosphate hydrolase protein n=1 Tax=Neurospora hispaniola TaxID=588809 RepID=A0AAJ0I7H6_9PEZI|nr:P-loop containing nucleoside triphosphate hydrolase protein [Neurospora hispaniola]